MSKQAPSPQHNDASPLPLVVFLSLSYIFRDGTDPLFSLFWQCSTLLYSHLTMKPQFTFLSRGDAPPEVREEGKGF